MHALSKLIAAVVQASGLLLLHQRDLAVKVLSVLSMAFR